MTKVFNNGSARHYLYADDGVSLLGEYVQVAAGGASASPLYEIVYLDGTPVLALSGGTVYYIQVDHLNAPRLVKNGASAVVWRWTSDAYGVGTADQNPSGEGVFEFNLRFPGQQYDVETGLYYNNARYYDPHTGRYISSDPIGLDGGVNTYAYVGNSPTTAVDPTGEFAFVLPFAVPPVVTYIAGTAAAAGFVAIVAKNPTVKAIVNAAASKVPRGAKEYVTYERYNASTGQYYNGRTSGYGDPNSIASSVLFTPRHCLLSLEGFGPVNFDRSTTNYYAIRGREQQRIDYRGGAMSVGGNSRNKINGVADFNLRRPQYMDAAIMEFGALPDNSPIRPRRQ